MSALFDVILPVFLIVAAGFAAVRMGWMSTGTVDALGRFTQNFAIPCLLFSAISTVDLGRDFNLLMLASFYIGATSGFAAGFFGARLIFGRPWSDSVAIGFVGLFSNSVMLGLPISERAFGTAALANNFAIVALHAPFCYLLGVTMMEVVRGGGRLNGATLARVLRSMFHNVLVLAIALGFAVNLTGLAVPGVVTDAVDLLARAALPTALFGLGGVLVQYRPEGDLRAILFVTAVSLLLHPAITYGLGRAFGLGIDPLRAAVTTAAMAPGVNTFIFASMYGKARRVAASAVLLGTAASLVTIWMWLTILP